GAFVGVCGAATAGSVLCSKRLYGAIYHLQSTRRGRDPRDWHGTVRLLHGFWQQAGNSIVPSARAVAQCIFRCFTPVSSFVVDQSLPKSEIIFRTDVHL